jgi:membrane-associated phospholipid phosphatase
MRFITDFADQAVVLPVALCVLAGFLALGWRAGARAWAVALVATLALMLVLKFLCLSCSADFFSPSGHTAAGTLLFGGPAALWLHSRISAPASLVVASLPAAILFAATRVALHVHSVAEVAAGAAAGTAGIALLLYLAGPPPTSLRAWRLALPAAALALALHGARLPIESTLRQAAGWWGTC